MRPMNTDKAVKELRKVQEEMVAERDELNKKIADIDEALKTLGAKRGPGRPRGSGKKAEVAAAAPAPAAAPSRKKVKRNWSPEAKKAASERMKAYWANKRK